MSTRHQQGFTLIEVLMVVAIMALLGAAGVGYYRNAVQRISAESTMKLLVSDLRLARAKSMAGDTSLVWGIHAVNAAADYYELFSTPSTYADAQMSVSGTTTLPSGMAFTDPSSGNTKDVLFTKITGTTSAVTISMISEGKSATATVTALGVVY